MESKKVCEKFTNDLCTKKSYKWMNAVPKCGSKEYLENVLKPFPSEEMNELSDQINSSLETLHQMSLWPLVSLTLQRNQEKTAGYDLITG